MRELIRKGSANEPEIVLDPDSERYFIRGRSIPEDAKLLYDDVLEWFQACMPQFKSPISLEINLDYFNTSTHKYLVAIIVVLSECEVKHSIKWCYEHDDEDLHETGKHLESVSGVPFEFVEIYED